MKVELITLEDLERFKDELIREVKQIISPAARQESQWLRSADVRRILKISPGTLQSLRISGTLPFTKVGSIHYYNHQDIQDLLKKGVSNGKA